MPDASNNKQYHRRCEEDSSDFRNGKDMISIFRFAGIFLFACMILSATTKTFSSSNIDVDASNRESLRATNATLVRLPASPEREKLSDSSMMAVLIDGDKHWYIRKRELEYYKDAFEVLEQSYRGQDESQLDIVTALGRKAVLEMEDSRGRVPACLDSFYKIWQSEEPFSGENFFAWLDYGSGRMLDSEKCDREKLNYVSYYFMNEKEIESSEVNLTVKKNESNSTVLLTFAKSGKVVPSGKYASIWGVDKKLYVFQDGDCHPDTGNGIAHRYWQGHCSLTHGAPVLHGGEMGIGENGTLLWTNPQSGHYRPQLLHVRNFFRWMRDTIGAPRSAVEWRPLTEGKPIPTPDEWEAIFNA